MKEEVGSGNIYARIDNSKRNAKILDLDSEREKEGAVAQTTVFTYYDANCIGPYSLVYGGD